MRIAINIIAVLAILIAIPIILAGPGTRLGLWDYGAGLSMIRQAALPVLAAAGVSLLAGIVAVATKKGGPAVFAILAAVVAGGAGMVPVKMKAAFEKNPFIHEVTTDFDNPPAIIAAANEERANPAEYRGGDPVPRREDGQTVADAQREAFPDIQPIIVDADLASAAAAAKEVVASMGMAIIADGPADAEAGGGWRIEAVATSKWFGFRDDFVVRLTPAGNGATRVDLRSKSRVGGSDLGANAARVREFAEKFAAAV